jgi:hypothetical protein
MYLRPTKKLCLLTVLVGLGAIILVMFISFTLAQELGAHVARTTHVRVNLQGE